MRVMEIRPELPDDQGLTGLLYRQAFIGTYEAELIDELRQSGVTPIALVAMDDGELVGHIMFATIGLEVDGRSVRSLALAEMAVHAGLQRKGIGGKLIRAGLEAARAQDYAAVVVLGHPTYYPSFGFSAERARHLRTPFRGGDAFMALELKPGALDGEDGVVKYPAAFRLGPLS
ncbi:MAG: GNAT family N-acetyltransferase [Janthinobacterium lividum]